MNYKDISIKRLILKDKFSNHCGIELLEVRPGYAKGYMNITDTHLNVFGSVHGGALFTLADFVFGCAANSQGRMALATNCSISYVKAQTSGYIIAEAEEISLGHKLATYIVTLKNQNNEKIAIFQGTAYRKKQEISE